MMTMPTNLMERRTDKNSLPSFKERRAGSKHTASSVARMFSFFVFTLCLFLAAPVYAQGLASVNTLLQQVLDVLQGAGVVVITIAIIWAGYKILFKGAGISDVMPVVLGAILIGGAAEIAALLLG